MRFFQLHPDAVLARHALEAPARTAAPSLAFSIGYGALSLGLVSVVAYSIWAFRLIRETGVMYGAIAAVYLGLGGLALSKLVIGRRHAGRFAGLFALAFLSYAILWCAFWFGLRGKHLADLWGAVAGLAAVTAILRAAFADGQTRVPFLAVFAALLALHSAGYYAGGWLYGSFGRSTGRLLWGAAHGIGFGAGLGYLLWQVQAPIRARLSRS